MSKRNKKNSQTRDDNGKFLRICSCINHYEWTFDQLFVIRNIVKSKFYGNAVINEMRKAGVIPARSHLLCNICYELFKQRFLNYPSTSKNNPEPADEEELHHPIGSNQEEDQPEDTIESENAIDPVKRVEELMRNLINQIKLLSPTEVIEVDKTLISSLVQTVAKHFVENDIFRDGKSLESKYKDTEYLKSLEPKNYLKERNQIILSFINGCCNIEYEGQNSSILYVIAVVVETIYYLRNLNLVLPHCFLLNLLENFISGSKSVSVLNGKTFPGAGYTTQKKWLYSKGENELSCPDNDVVTYFDNIGKYIKKNYRVSSQKYQSPDIITLTLHISLNANLQKREDLKPVNWNCESKKEQHKKMKDLIDHSNSVFRKLRIEYVKHILEIVMFEEDNVEKKITQKNESVIRKCSNGTCNKVFTNLKRICDICNSKIEVKQTPEKRIKSLIRGILINPSMVIGEPVLLNPNSFVNIKEILNQYKKIHDIDEEKKWVFLGCDGPPYRIASKIIEEDRSEYDWVSLIPGLGHLHMNQMKGLFKVLDQIVLEALGKEVLNFKSPKAYSYFLSASDTHKAFQSVEILLHGTTSEFCVQYIAHCKKKNTQITPEGCVEWLAKVENETIAMLNQFILNYALAIYLQKIGVRYNDPKFISAGRYKFMPIFFAFNHPIYREIEYRDLVNFVSYPAEVKDLVTKNMAFSSSDLPNNHQGGDFCLEGKIKRHKMIAPKGDISNETWKRLSRGFDNISSICNQTKSMLEINCDESYRNPELYDEISSWRALLRTSKMLSNKKAEGFVHSIYGETLSPELEFLTENVEEKMEKFFSLVEQGSAINNKMYNNLVLFEDDDDDEAESESDEYYDSFSDED